MCDNPSQKQIMANPCCLHCIHPMHCCMTDIQQVRIPSQRLSLCKENHGDSSQCVATTLHVAITDPVSIVSPSTQNRSWNSSNGNTQKRAPDLSSLPHSSLKKLPRLALPPSTWADADPSTWSAKEWHSSRSACCTMGNDHIMCKPHPHPASQ